VTDISLKEIFDAAAALDKTKFRNRSVIVEKDIYDKYIRLYHWTRALCDKLDAVIEDGEHRLGMEEGRQTGWNLPDPDFMKDDVTAMKKMLRSLDPFGVTHTQDGRVRVNVTLAVGMHYMAEADRLMIHKLFNMFREKDYLPYHRHLRDMGIKYAGPTSLGEIFNTMMYLAHTKSYTKKYMDDRKIDHNWPQKLLT